MASDPNGRAINLRDDPKLVLQPPAPPRIALAYGRPKRIRVDNGPEFISKELDLWAWMHGVELDFSRPGKPTDNAFAESFNGKFRTECPNAYWFLSLDDARLKCEAWREDYNEVVRTVRSATKPGWHGHLLQVGHA